MNNEHSLSSILLFVLVTLMLIALAGGIFRMIKKYQLFSDNSGQKLFMIPFPIMYMTVLGVFTLFLVSFGGMLFRLSTGESTVVAGKSDHAVIFVLDISASMGVYDVNAAYPKYRRIVAAKELVTQIIRKNPTAQYGFVTFTGDAYVEVPVTEDPSLISVALETTNIRKSSTFLGSSVVNSLRTTFIRMLADRVPEKTTIIVLSDGEEMGDNLPQLTTLFNETDLEKFPVQLIGIGSRELHKIPVVYKYQAGDSVLTPNFITYDMEVSYYKYSDGSSEPRSKREDALMQEIAQKTRGTFITLEKMDDINSIAEQFSQSKILQKGNVAGSVTVKHEVYYLLAPWTLFTFILVVKPLIFLKKRV